MRTRETWRFRLFALLSLVVLLSCAKSQSRIAVAPAPEKPNGADSGIYNPPIRLAPEDCIFEG